MSKPVNLMREALNTRVFRGFAYVAAAGCLFATAGAAQSPSIALLDGLEKGAWEIRYRDSTPPRRICVRSGFELVQLRHAGTACSKYAVEQGTGDVTVQYSCKPNGFGRTKVRRETRALVQLDGNGVEGGLPYQFAAEARRVGSC